jgi:hypothetical protein
VYLTLLLCVQFPERLPLDYEEVASGKWECFSIATALSLCTVAFATLTNVVTLQNDLANPVRRSIKKVKLLLGLGSSSTVTAPR